MCIINLRSEFFKISLVVSTDGASQGELFFSVVRVFDLERAFGWGSTLRELMLFLAGEVVSVILPFVAVVTEVSRAPAEPGSHLTAELALEVDEIFPMQLAICDACSHHR